MHSISLHSCIPSILSDIPIQSEVWGASYMFKKGERYLIKGGSGSGKSSLCSFIMGYRSDYEGVVAFDNKEIASFHSSQWEHLRRTALSYVPQGLMLFDTLTAFENILLKNELTQHKNETWILQTLQRVGLEGREHFPVSKLSFGQKQRVAIVRALCQPFHFLLLDEPVSHLDDETIILVSSLLEEEVNAQKAGVIAASIGKEINFAYNDCLTI